MEEGRAAVRTGRSDELGDGVDDARRLHFHFAGALAGEVGLDQEGGHAATVVGPVTSSKLWGATRNADPWRDRVLTTPAEGRMIGA